MDKGIDISKNIKVIELLKADLLNSTAELFSLMIDEDARNFEREETLARIISSTYLLADRIGLSFKSIDTRLLNQVKISLIEENDKDMQKQLLKLSEHMSNFND